MKKIFLLVGLVFFGMSINAQEKKLDYNKAKINAFFDGFELKETKDYVISLSPNYIKETTPFFSIYNPITQQTLMYNSQMELTSGLLSLDNLTRNVKRDSFNPHGATDFKNALGIGVANTILQLLQK